MQRVLQLGECTRGRPTWRTSFESAAALSGHPCSAPAARRAAAPQPLRKPAQHCCVIVVDSSPLASAGRCSFCRRRPDLGARHQLRVEGAEGRLGGLWARHQAPGKPRVAGGQGAAPGQEPWVERCCIKLHGRSAAALPWALARLIWQSPLRSLQPGCTCWYPSALPSFLSSTSLLMLSYNTSSIGCSPTTPTSRCPASAWTI